MTSKVMLSVRVKGTPPPVQVQQLPFTVVAQDNAPWQAAAVSTYFLVRECGVSAAAGPFERVLHASFRGRELKGVRVPVPAGYVGAVVSVEPQCKRARTAAGDGRTGRAPAACG